jgi:hypothetical protein
MMKNDAVVKQRRYVQANAHGARMLDEIASQIKQMNKKDVDPALEKDVLKSEACLDFIVMLLCRAEQFLGEGAFDISALLAYRASEAMIQRRLAIRGEINPGDVDWSQLTLKSDHSTTDSFIEAHNHLVKNSKYYLAANNLPRQISRAGAFSLLKAAFTDQDIANCIDVDTFSGVGNARNRSILAHGFLKLDQKSAQRILEMAKKLFDRLVEVEALSAEKREQLFERHRFISINE